MSPTQRTLKHLREQGYRAAIVEHWNSFAKIRQDLFGIIDVLAVGSGETIAVQCTSGTNVSARVAKIANSDITPILRASGWKLIVHGWRKAANGRWTLREVDCS
jgi:hypothetical protein